MLIGRYHFSCRFQTDAFLPEYKGSTFRGVFGHALKKVVCVLRKQECADCLLRHKCIYVLIFEPRLQEVQCTELRRFPDPPKPYVIECCDNSKTRYSSNDTFDFVLILFGKANEYLPYFIYAFEHIGQQGIGKRKNGEAGIFTLHSVSIHGREIYNARDRKIKGNWAPEEIDPFEEDADERVCVGVELLLHTPLRLKYENHLEANLPFHILTRAVLRRISSLCAFYGDGEPPLDYRGLVERAKSVKVTRSTLRWYDWRRYSNRQGQAMLMGGMIGKVVYEGEVGEYLPLLQFCEKTHLGKQTTFGLGRISVFPIR